MLILIYSASRTYEGRGAGPNAASVGFSAFGVTAMCVCVCVWILRWLVRAVLPPQPAHPWVSAAAPLPGAASLGAGVAPRLAGLARQAASVPIAGRMGVGKAGARACFFLRKLS